MALSEKVDYPKMLIVAGNTYVFSLEYIWVYYQ